MPSQLAYHQVHLPDIDNGERAAITWCEQPTRGGSIGAVGCRKGSAMHRSLHSSAETREQLPRITDLRIKNSSDDPWPAVRQTALVRDGHRCAKCEAANRSELDVHHRMPRSILVDHTAANLITLCDGCHPALHLYLHVGLARAVIQRCAVRLARALPFYHA